MISKDGFRRPVFLLLLLLLSIPESRSFTTTPTVIQQRCRQQQQQQIQLISPFDNPHMHILNTGDLYNKNNISPSALSASRAARAVTWEDRDNDNNLIFVTSIIVGIVTATMGYIYGQVLGTSVHLIWNILPNLLLHSSSSSTQLILHPLVFMTCTCTLGALFIGLLSSIWKPNSFTVADFVSAFSAATPKSLPAGRIALLPLLTLSLLTSTFGFSVGPEAPMVCAGGIVGASLGQKIYNRYATTTKSSILDRASLAATFAYSGAAGALTAFMGIPIAGSIFALELTSRSSGGVRSAGALSPAIAASLAALMVIRGILIPAAPLGGHFDYGMISSIISGRTMMACAIGCGVAGAVIGTVFHKTVDWLKHMLWPDNPTESKSAARRREILIKGTIGLIVGLLSSYYPQTLFWGEGSLQCVIDGQRTAFEATKHGIPAFLTSMAKVNTAIPYPNAAAALQVGCFKLIAIILACAGKFPGGIIFPLFFAAAPFAHAAALALSTPSLVPVLVISLMSSTQAAVTRTPLASALILTLTASSSTALSVLLPACLVSSYIGVWVSKGLSSKSYFQYSKE